MSIRAATVERIRARIENLRLSKPSLPAGCICLDEGRANATHEWPYSRGFYGERGFAVLVTGRCGGGGSAAPALQEDDSDDAGADERHLPEGAPFDVAAVEIRDQIGHRDVEEIAGGEGEHVWQRQRHRL